MSWEHEITSIYVKIISSPPYYILTPTVFNQKFFLNANICLIGIWCYILLRNGQLRNGTSIKDSKVLSMMISLPYHHSNTIFTSFPYYFKEFNNMDTKMSFWSRNW